ncbi:MAG: acetyl-CoA C-acetyltransferase, partial [Flavobacteriales bacterium]
MIAERTPVLIAAGQVVEREASNTSPMQLAAIAARNAITNAGSDDIISHIDTIAVTRLFSDMGELWPCPWGRSNNPPESIARQLGAKPKYRIYSQVGGNEPQAFVIEFARDIAMGNRDMVLIAGAEATKNQRYATRNNTVLNWHEQFSEPLDDRGIDASVVTDQEI